MAETPKSPLTNLAELITAEGRKLTVGDIISRLLEKATPADLDHIAEPYNAAKKRTGFYENTAAF